MAFDKDTRNKLQKLVTHARTLLTEEFTRQLQGTYGIQPTGEITPLGKLGRLDDATLATARLLQNRIHHLASQSAGKQVQKEAIQRVLREQAFTVLNRFAALKMAESRGIVQECVGGGFDSKGFKVFLTVAGTALGETYDRYKVFLYCLYDELSLDLGVLFDRFSPYGLLFPRETALKELFDLLNQAELKHLWAEDEAVGWIYQYFNDEAERKKMRKESTAPRNSRELAVRNQFFTPRYVVQFLVDNSLGRTWYEMLQGNTRLKESCEYLVRRPNEVFLVEGEEAPEDDPTDDLSEEELLKQPVHIPFRAIKDPREIRLLDPACGSMHFGLYAFDLFELIYEEAWDRDLCPKLKADFPDKETLLREVPRLIIEHNLHGVDIDPRAAQIAGLSLWLRAQKSWQQLKVKPEGRPQIKRSNIVCAEPMPGEVEHLRDFTESLNQPAIGKMVELIFDKMKLAGEAGTLLKIEKEIAHLVATAKKDWQTGPKLQQSELFSESTPTKTTQSELGLDMSGITDEAFWDKAEERIYKALRDYSEQADGDFTRRLFAEDAARGFAFIDVCRKRYDVVVMNPPFGELTNTATSYLKKNFDAISGNILCAFIERSAELLIGRGHSGFIVDKTIMIKSSYEKIRKVLLGDDFRLLQMCDLGWGILDGAQVETVCATAGKPDNNGIWFSNKLSSGITLHEEGSIKPASFFRNVPNSAIAYDLDSKLLSLFTNSRRVEPGFGYVRQGLGISDSWRWYRAVSELPAHGLKDKKYSRLINGGGFAPYYRDYDLAINWVDDGYNIKATEGEIYGSWSRTVKNVKFYGKRGISYPKRTEHLNSHILPPGFIFTVEGLGLFPDELNDATHSILEQVCLMNSKLMGFLINRFCGQHKHVGYIKSLPLPADGLAADALTRCEKIIQIKQKWSTYFVNTALFISPALFLLRRLGAPLDVSKEDMLLKDITNEIALSLSEAEKVCNDCQKYVDKTIYDSFGIEDLIIESIEEDTKGRPHISVIQGVVDADLADSTFLLFDLFEYLKGTIVGRWDIHFATGEKEPPPLPGLFDPLPLCPPGMLQNGQGLPAESKDVPGDYPLRISWSGILVDEEGHPEDIVTRVQDALRVIWRDKADAIEQEACEILKMKSLRAYFGTPNKFFADHLKRYSKSRRQAPIYWPLSTPSGSYTLWLYYHRLTDQTLFSCVNDFIDPKLAEVSGDLNRLQGVDQRSADDERELERLADLKQELTDMREELLRVAQLPYKPDLNDGVIINAAPLAKLFGLKKWQKSCQDCWDKLHAGDYDWAHLAMHIWPDRVREKCKTDKSLAIAHNCEDLYEEPPEQPKKRARKKKAQPTEASELNLKEG